MPNAHPEFPIKYSRADSIWDKSYGARKIACNLQNHNIIFMIRFIYAAAFSGTQAKIAAFWPKKFAH